MGASEDGEEVEYGREPSPIPLKPSVSNAAMPFQPSTRMHLPVLPDKFKAVTSLVLFILLVICFVLGFSAIKNHGLFCGSTPNEETVIRQASMIEWSNKSSHPCTSFYDYACGTFESRYSSASVFAMTQNELWTKMDHATNIITELQARVSQARNETYPPAALHLAGIFPCLSFEVDTDYADRTRYAMYVSGPCKDCQPSRDYGAPIEIGGQFAADIQTIRTKFGNATTTALLDLHAFVSDRNMYWLPPNGTSDSFRKFLQSECTIPDNLWQSTLDDDVEVEVLYQRALNDAYEQSQLLTNVSCGPSSLQSPDPGCIMPITFLPKQVQDASTEIIDKVRQLSIEILENVGWAAGQKEALQDRARTMPITISSGEGLIESCNIGLHGIFECISARWDAQLSLLRSPINLQPVDEPRYDLSAAIVNAVYDPLQQAIQVSPGLLRQPFFSNKWPLHYQMASLGFVIAHELGHALSPTLIAPWSAPNQSTIRVTPAVEAQETCLIGALNASGSHRSIRVLQEAWADSFAASVVLRFAREQRSSEMTRVALISMVQNFCAAGTPRTPEAVLGPEADSHPTPFIRSTTMIYGASKSGLASGFGCPVETIQAPYRCVA